MKSKVVHVRIPLRTLAGVVELVRKGGINPDSMPLSSIVSKALQGAVYSYSQAGLTKVFQSDEEAAEFLEPWMSGDDMEDTTPIPAFTIGPDDEEEEENKPRKRTVEEIREELEARMSERAAEGAALDQIEVNKNPVRPARRSTLDLTNLQRRPFAELAKTAPKDIYILRALGQNDRQLMKAIEYAYPATPVPLWGTSGAWDLIERCMDALDSMPPPKTVDNSIDSCDDEPVIDDDDDYNLTDED